MSFQRVPKQKQAKRKPNGSLLKPLWRHLNELRPPSLSHMLCTRIYPAPSRGKAIDLFQAARRAIISRRTSEYLATISYMLVASLHILKTKPCNVFDMDRPSYSSFFIANNNFTCCLFTKIRHKFADNGFCCRH